MSGGKNRVKNDRFLNGGARAENYEKLFENIVFFCMLSCQNTVNTSVFGWFALRTASKKMKKPVVFAVHLKPLLKKHCKHNVFYAVAKKTV